MAPGISSAAPAATMVSKATLKDGSYCHMKFPAIVEETFGTTQPVLKMRATVTSSTSTERVVTIRWAKMKFIRS
jgi:hypothetical protein